MLLSPALSAQLEHSVAGEPVAPITVHNPKNLPWPGNVAQKVYFEACAATALQLNPSHPADLHPAIVVELGADQDSADFIDQGKEPQATIYLKKWDEPMFALGVVIVARDASIDNHTAQVLAHRAVVMVESQKTVQQEKEQK